MLFESESYRAYLGDELVRRIGANPRYSQRAFARQLGLGPGELSEILRGKRKLTLKAALKISQSLGHTETEQRHLLSLVQRDEQALVVSKRADPSANRRHNLTLDLFAVVSEWYYFAILNLSECEGFTWDPKQIAKRLGISVSEVRVAIDRMERVQLIERRNGTFRVVAGHVFTESGIPSEAVKRFHRQMLSKALQALETQSVEERDFSGITLAIKPAQIPAIKKELALLTEHVAEKFGSSKGKKEVYQLETIFFRLSQNG